MRKYANLLDINELDMDTSGGTIPGTWQRKFIAAGAEGRVPLDTYTLDDGREVLNVADLDVELLQHPDGRAVSQNAIVQRCDDVDELESFLEIEASQDEREIQRAILQQQEGDVGG